MASTCCHCWSLLPSTRCSPMILFLRSNVSGLGKYRLDSLLSITDRLLLILICGVLLWRRFQGQFRIEWFAWSQTAHWGRRRCSITGSSAGIFPRCGFRFHWWFCSCCSGGRPPYALAVFLTSIYNRIDGRVMVERLLPDGQVEADLYASAFRLFVSNMIGFCLPVYLLPSCRA